MGYKGATAFRRCWPLVGGVRHQDKENKGRETGRAIALISSSTAVSLALLSNRRALTRLPSKQGALFMMYTHELKRGFGMKEQHLQYGRPPPYRHHHSLHFRNRSCLSKGRFNYALARLCLGNPVRQNRQVSRTLAHTLIRAAPTLLTGPPPIFILALAGSLYQMAGGWPTDRWLSLIHI